MKRYLFLLSLMTSTGYAQQLSYFPPELLQVLIEGDQDVDLSYVERGLDASPGIYLVDVYVNQNIQGSRSIEFREHDGMLLPVLSLKHLEEMGFDFENNPEYLEILPQGEIFPLTSYIPEVTQRFDVARQRLDISIPQIYQKRSSINGDVVSSDMWDYGIPAAMLGYYVSGAHYDLRHSNESRSNFHLGLSGQINYGPWRLYSQGNYSYSRAEIDGKPHSNDNWDLWSTYLQRDLVSLRSRLRLGEINTAGDILDSFSMRGLSLQTNEEMLHVTERSFMPSIMGVANSYAQVIIRQNGHVVYQTNVAPGPWHLDNLPAFGNDGDLEVIVREADGTEHIEFYPYSSVPLMLREGQWRYNINAGQYYRRNSDADKPWFVMGSISYGLPHDVTIYGGSLLSGDYQSVVLGSALSLGTLGALSFDVTQANTRFDGLEGQKEYSGAAYRLRYEKTMLSTGTTVNFMNYQYRSGNYWTFQEVNERGQGVSFWSEGRQKDRLQFSLNQYLNKWGSLSASGSRTTYRDGSSDTKTWQFGYGVNVRNCNLYLNYSRSYAKYNDEWRPEERFMINLDVPLSLFTSHSVAAKNGITANYKGNLRKNVDGKEHYEQSASVRGWLPDWDVNWEVEQTFGQQNERSSSAMLAYSGDQFGGSASFTRTHDMNTYQMAANGSLLVHSGGVTASARAYDSVALVDVDGLENVKINKWFNVRTDSNGYAVLTSLRNYSQNEVVIDPASLPEGALLLEGTNKNVYPMSGSVVRVKFPARLGKQAIIQLLRSDGHPLPFGAKVVLLDEKGQEDVMVNGIVGDDGSVYLSGLPAEANLVAKWKNNGQNQSCEYHYVLPQKEATKAPNEFEEIPEITLTPIDENQN